MSSNHVQNLQAQMNNLFHEIKNFKQYAKQLNILLDETLNSFKELKSLQVSFTESLDEIKLTENQVNYIRSLSKNRLGFIIFGQNVLAKSLIANELLIKNVLPYQLENTRDEKWRLIRIKFGKVPHFSYQLVESDFEIMNLNRRISNEDEGVSNDSNNNSNRAQSTFLVDTEDLRINLDNSDDEENSAIVEINIESKLLDLGCEIIVHSDETPVNAYEKLTQSLTPVFIYAITEPKLTDEDIKQLNRIKDLVKNKPIFFIKIPEIDSFAHMEKYSKSENKSQAELNELRKELNQNLIKYLQQKSYLTQVETSSAQSIHLYKQLHNLNLINSSEIGTENTTTSSSDGTTETHANSEICDKWNLFYNKLNIFLRRYLRKICVDKITSLFKFHERCLNNFINHAYEMARDMLITPRKLEYAREKEQVLFDSLNALTSIKQEELKNLIVNTINANREAILNEARDFQFVDIETMSTESDFSSLNIDNILTTSIASHESHASLVSQSSVSSQLSSPSAVKTSKDFKRCTQQIQELVINRLNSAIGQQITDSVEVLKENYVGTLKRCLQTLEEMNSSENASASEALKQIIHSAYQVELTLTGSSNMIRSLIDRMKELLRNMPWSNAPKLDAEWKVQIAENMLDSLSESKLSRALCNQMRERLKSSHNQFTNSLRILEIKHSGRLEKSEETQAIIRKVLAPKFAKLCLESTSLKDFVLYGMPQLGKEIGRGQYGVVYTCHKWAKYTNLAIKSVVPPDDKHWNDLALEFHYTKQITDHDRIVKLIGSVIDYAYGNGQSPAVLLVMEGMKRDLYTALRSGLDWVSRLQISMDVVEGIRYLHGRGLVHRDIKLKNVLLDSSNRAKITDLGFCKPEAMMCGSIVGTPVHMAPEVFNTKYDNSVDIYAFGILFWYICSGQVRLPQSFEQCSNKDDLWSAVKRGRRPEKLNVFDEDCWNLMEMCWKHDPKDRPHIGEVSVYLDKIFSKFKTN